MKNIKLSVVSVVMLGISFEGLAEPSFVLENPQMRPLAECYASALQIYANTWQSEAAKSQDRIQALHRILVMTGGYMSAAESIMPICEDDYRTRFANESNKQEVEDSIKIVSYVFRVESRKRQAEVYANCLAKKDNPAWKTTYEFCKKMYNKDRATERKLNPNP